jgi:hypothetical protein
MLNRTACVSRERLHPTFSIHSHSAFCELPASFLLISVQLPELSRDLSGFYTFAAEKFVSDVLEDDS